MKYHRFCDGLQGGRESIDLSGENKKVEMFLLLLFITLLVLTELLWEFISLLALLGLVFFSRGATQPEH